MTNLPASAGRRALVRRAIALECLGIVWMMVEAGVALVCGVAARSLTLSAFGLDSLIEVASAIVLIRRLGLELRHGRSVAEIAERRAGRIAGALLLLLAAYVAVMAGWSLWTRQGGGFSWPGFSVALAAMPLMWLLSRGKLRVAEALGSGALRADAVESIACLWLSGVVVVGLFARLVTGAWWVDAATALALLPLLVKEGREAWRGEAADGGLDA